MIDFKKKLEEWKAAGKSEFNYLTDEGVIKMANAINTSKLSKLSAMWKKVAPIQASFSNVPDSDYVGDLKEMKLTEAKKEPHRLQVETTIEIADGDYIGKTVKRFDGVEDEQGMGYFKNICEVIGFDIPDDMNLWQEAMDEFIANNKDLFNITTKSNNGYTNVYINGVSEYTKGEEGEQVEEVVEEQVEEVVEEEQVEEVVEEVVEEEPQEVTPPTRRVIAAKPVAKAVAQPVRKVAAAQPVTVKKVVAAQPAKKAAVAQPVRKVVALRK